MNEDKPVIIIIGESYDGFRLTADDFSVWISQKELPTKNLKKFFKSLGFKVKVEKEY